jgi:hypothetical protein
VFTEEQRQRHLQALNLYHEIDKKYPKENTSEGEGNKKEKKQRQGRGRRRRREDSKEVAADSTPKMTPSEPTPWIPWRPMTRRELYLSLKADREEASRHSPAITEQSPSSAVPSMTYTGALNPAPPSSATRRRPNFGSLPPDEEE